MKMRYPLHREHKYIAHVLHTFEDMVATVDFTNKEETMRVLQEFQSHAAMLQSHAAWEDSCLHSLLRAKGSHVGAHLVHEHEEIPIVCSRIEQMLRDIIDHSDETKMIALGHDVFLAIRRFIAENALHMVQEELEIVPELYRLYTDQELAAVEHETYKQMSHEEIAKMYQHLFAYYNVHDKRALLDDLQGFSPAAYEYVKASMKDLS